jgi:diguanylate cyclase (GGDEF)-like protein
MTDKQKILIVDDELQNLSLLREVLKDEYEVYSENTGINALKTAEDIIPDLILLDIMMPEMDGFQVFRGLKSDPLLRNIPVAFVTALEKDEDQTAGLELGAVDYITKPFNPSILKLRVKNILKLKKQADIISGMTLTDNLTGIPDMLSFESHIKKEWRRALRNKKPLSLLIIEIDAPHPTDRSYLKNIADILKNTVVRPGDMVARYGNERFACVLPETDSDGGFIIAEKMRRSVYNANFTDEPLPCESFVTISIGVSSCIPEHGFSPDTLMEQATLMLLRAKNDGGNMVLLYAYFTEDIVDNN